ncbi:hypothetical protein TNIN_386851 [Trichonephila inaurata madagascariensis]|uniref:Uncharacterized protein n=1 Tax=Trichonephila inaurata madagascariensis TaxID=2747483 RepID=A0A8X6Y7M8_9ARAC|nr:hypothetical protein TNIN_386851 [Trichonephila inaurata madagascariensis]
MSRKTKKKEHPSVLRNGDIGPKDIIAIFYYAEETCLNLPSSDLDDFRMWDKTHSVMTKVFYRWNYRISVLKQGGKENHLNGQENHLELPLSNLDILMM